MNEPLIPIDPGRQYTLAELDGIIVWGEKYEAMLDREYDGLGEFTMMMQELAALDDEEEER